MSEVILLDTLPGMEELKNFSSGASRVYVAASMASLKVFEEKNRQNPGALCVWVYSKSQFTELRGEAERLGAQFIFPYGKLKVSEIVSGGSFAGPASFEIPDARIEDLNLLKPSVEVLQKASVLNPEISVIIPSFDNDERMKKALSTWLVQDYSSYEIIVVDDGSTTSSLQGWVGKNLEHLTLLRLSRTKNRKRGDHNFRAGLARNCGFELSRGQKIVFCDSDIAVPPSMLSSMSSSLESFDIVMPRRWQLNEASSNGLTAYSDIQFDRDVVLSPGAFWESFQTEKSNWMDHANHWRWTSTFCLGTHRSHLLSLGTFKKTFVTYGFEDTELGYRFYRAGKRFSFLPINTYHLHQPETHSEYKNDARTKKKLLKISAERFFRHHPHKEVYQALQTWLDD